MLETFRGYNGRQLNLHALGIVVSLSGLLVVAPMLPEIIDYFGVSAAEAGVSISFMWACNAAAQFPGGRYSDRLSAGVVLLGSQGVMILGFLVLAVATTFPVFVAGLGLIGAGYGLFEPAGFVLLQTQFEENRGRAFGVRDAAVNLGSALSAVLVVAIVGTFTWRDAFVPVVVLLALVGAGTHRLNCGDYAVSRVTLDLKAVCSRLFRERETYAVLVVMSVSMFLWQGSASFLPAYLQAVKSFTSFEATVAFASMFVVGMVVTPVAGTLSDAWSPTGMGVAAMGFGVVGLSTLVLVDSTVGVGLGLIAYAIAITAIWPVMYVYLSDVLATETIGGDLGVLRTVYFAVGSLGPAYIGTAATRLGYTAAFASLLVGFGLAAIPLVWLGRRE
ncbi:MFS transporter [Haloferax volcanii]|uniref:MFS transporter n=1 Tax=Haloferax volcanii TaxID=2246 RepID=UPI00349FCB87